jgi:hypothetical protein
MRGEGEKTQFEVTLVEAVVDIAALDRAIQEIMLEARRDEEFINNFGVNPRLLEGEPLFRCLRSEAISETATLIVVAAPTINRIARDVWERYIRPRLDARFGVLAKKEEHNTAGDQRQKRGGKRAQPPSA